jgi:16S rRNA (guanine527-N7)-methyltransferase
MTAEAIAARAAACGVRLPEAVAAALAAHARAVLDANARLHLTTVVEPAEFLERHLGEAFEGAALLPEDVTGLLIDVGSGNGFPALPLAAARPGLAAVLVEASNRKADFLRSALRAAGLERVRVVERQVQRAADLADLGPARLLTLRAVGGWSRLLPKLAAVLGPDGEAFLWAGDEVERVRRREAWRRLVLRRERPLPGMERARIWVFGAATA